MENHSLGRMVAALVSPYKTFQSIAERPTWLVAVLVLIGISVLTIAIAAPKMDWEATVRSEIAKSGQQVSAEQMETQVEIVEKFGNVMLWGSVTVFPWIIYALMAAIFLALFRLVGNEMSFKQSLSVVVHGLLPWGLAGLLSLPILMSRDTLISEQLEQGVLLSHLGPLVGDDASPTLEAFATSINFFSFWSMALMTIGFSFAAKASTKRAAFVVVGLWLFYVLGKVGLTGLGQMLAG